MAWSERQVTMLRAMGLRTWQPVADTALAAPVPAPVAGARPSSPAPQLAGAPAALRRPVPAAAPAPAEPATAVLRAAPVTAAPTGGVAPPLTLDWPALRDAVAACRACALCETRKQTVFGTGHPQAHWMVIGEAPGAQEDQRGEPFVGAAGQLLDHMLRALGVSRDAAAPPEQAVYIANTLKCRPPDNRNPTPEEMARCEPFLQRQLALVQPRVILAMGAFAIRALLRTTDPVGQLRGRVHRFQGVPLIVTYHPAYLLRTPAHKARAWDDLCLAASVLEGQGG
jgi:DNA polymerase